MAGTDRSKVGRTITGRAGTGAAAPSGGGFAVILVDPQLGENIGMVARAMLNCGLTELRLVRPRDGWPSASAAAAASGADEVLERAALFDTTADAIADLERVYATTTRSRDMTKDVVTPAAAAATIRARPDLATGILFGGESKGLRNDDVALADAIVTAPLNPGFTSLNLAQAVLLVGYEWFKPDADAPDAELAMPGTRPATKADLAGLFGHLESALDDSGFLHVAEKRPTMVRNLRNLLQRARLTEQEVRTLRGVIASLVTFGPRKRGG
jgi:tRNA/rRNA methyltransferase